MAVFKIVEEAYKKPDDISREINYILNPKKCIHEGYSNLCPGDITVLTNQFFYVKNYYRKSGGKQFEHFVLAFDTSWEEKDISWKQIITAVYYIIDSVFKGYQVVYAVHRQEHIHVHFIMNSVNMITGKHFHLNRTEFYKFMNTIAESLLMQKIALKGFSYFDEKGVLHFGKSETNIGLYDNKPPAICRNSNFLWQND